MTSFTRRWTPTGVVCEILAAAADGQDLNYAHMRGHAPALVRAAEREFGAWSAAIEAAGFDYATIRRYRKWSRERIVERIRELHDQGVDLSWQMITRMEPPLAAAALHAGRFGSWNEALRAAGLDPAKIARYQRWSPEAIDQEVQRLAERGVPLTRRAVKAHAAALMAAIDRTGGGLTAVTRRFGAPRRAARTDD